MNTASVLHILEELLELLPGNHTEITAELRRCAPHLQLTTELDRTRVESLRNALRLYTNPPDTPASAADLGWLCANVIYGIERSLPEYSRLALTRIAGKLNPGSLVVWFLCDTDEPVETYPRLVEFLATHPDAAHTAGSLPSNVTEPA
jgi:hypothetical protein